jgi:hypothetical protein
MEFSTADEELTILDNDEEPELTDFSMEDLLTMIGHYLMVTELFLICMCLKVSRIKKLQSYFR